MNDKLKISGIIEESIVDGPGIRYVIFAQGCPHQCPGCHNINTHCFTAGKYMDVHDILKNIYSNPLVQGVTFSGGEPVCQASVFVSIAKDIKANGKHIMMYTGYTFEQLMAMDDDVKELLSLCDIIVDGKFIENEKSLMLKFRGSKNQRIIDVPLSLNNQDVICINM